MKKLLLFILTVLLLSGCSIFDNVEKSISLLDKSVYSDMTIKGTASIEVPETLIASDMEKQVIEQAKDINYHIKQKNTSSVNYIDADIVMGGNQYNFKSYTDDKESLMYNGTGWFFFEKKPNLNINAFILTDIIKDAVLLEKDNFKTNKQKITFNEKKVDTKIYQVSLNENSLKQLEQKNGLKFSNLDLTIFSEKNKPRVIQYAAEFSKPSEFGDSIKVKTEGQILITSIDEGDIETPKPEISKSYRTIEDFLIELLLKDSL